MGLQSGESPMCLPGAPLIWEAPGAASPTGASPSRVTAAAPASQAQPQSPAAAGKPEVPPTPAQAPRPPGPQALSVALGEPGRPAALLFVPLNSAPRREGSASPPSVRPARCKELRAARDASSGFWSPVPARRS